jgi:hypothetical protein
VWLKFDFSLERGVAEARYLNSEFPVKKKTLNGILINASDHVQKLGAAFANFCGRRGSVHSPDKYVLLS